MSESTIINIVGTDTDVGKTVVTAALAAALVNQGRSVALYKPAQTGVQPQEMGDVQYAAALSGASPYEGVRFLYPMAPVAAAQRENRENKDLPSLQEHQEAIQELADQFDVVIVEGAGGVTVDLTVPLSTGTGYTSQNQADLIRLLPSEAVTFIIARAGLGTLNHTALTADYLGQRGIETRGVIIGSWPQNPQPVEESNLQSLARQGFTVLATLPAGAGKSFVVGGDEALPFSEQEIRQFRQDSSQWMQHALVALDMS
ncbi:dethiobiotin synthase [Rothia nasimurium]|uniref:ATP-dependent dethiobiotin synthetase BioD n=1 Tax=Rothia nasimurium TaxID=85336 RepID=A0A4Y9F3Y6_9MICC|nr:dethiobiotin synthase [Rothia nasimurium]MBF0808012.1 dethiobiotin synthase [Rothia nasimurium]TFU22736.1 dethiobiotin synthase [Rothia nasimurium]